MHHHHHHFYLSPYDGYVLVELCTQKKKKNEKRLLKCKRTNLRKIEKIRHEQEKRNARRARRESPSHHRTTINYHTFGSTRNYNFLKHATQNVAGDMLVSKSGFEPRGTESRRSTTPSHGNMRLRLSSTETLKRVLVVPPTKIRIWT